MTTALVCIALLGLLVFGLGFAVSLTRSRTNTADPFGNSLCFVSRDSIFTG